MYSQHPHSLFKKPLFYVLTDLSFLLFFVLFIVGDQISIFHDNNFNPLMYFKIAPVWILIYQLWSLREAHPSIFSILVALFFGFIGDIFLLVGLNNTILFSLGATSFQIGHIINVFSFVRIASDLAEGRVSLRNVLKKVPLFIVMWIILLTFSFWSISFMVRELKPEQVTPYMLVLAVYGSCLVLLTMGAFFYFFTTSHISTSVFTSGALFVAGALIFFASDNFLAHGKFNQKYPFFTDKQHSDPLRQSINCILKRVTYFVAQWLIAKGVFFLAVHQVGPRETKLTTRED